ncbi:MAG: hypothetical protein ACQCXQ_01650 [Verrucomicrobiales bacterium]|nr:hypothetical protein [Verrucomicrobiota bacterium JB025]
MILHACLTLALAVYGLAQLAAASTLFPQGNEGVTMNDATFTAIPEPAAAFLGSFGLLGLLRRRR